MAFCYDYPRPMVTVDILVLHPQWEAPQEILLIRRKNPPFEGHWAFPGGFCDMDETLEEAAIRELQEETSIKADDIRQFLTVSTVDRDPRGRSITTVFFTGLNKADVTWRAADDAADAKWFDVNNRPRLAFDHEQIMAHFLKMADRKHS